LESIPFKNTAIILIALTLIISTLSFVTLPNPNINPNPQPIPTDGTVVNALTPEVTLNYQSTPTKTNATLNQVLIQNGSTHKFNIGAIATLTAPQVQNYTFSHWRINSIDYTANSITIDILSNISAIAVYTQIPSNPETLLNYSSTPINADALLNGTTISSGDSVQIENGSSITLLASQNPNYDFSYWLINNVTYLTNQITIDIISDTHAIANYIPKQPTPTPTPNPTPTPTPTPPPIPNNSTMIVGVNMYSGVSNSQFNARDLPLLQEIGINYIRIGTGVSDSNVNRALENGIDIIGTFGRNGLPDLQAFGDYIYNRVNYFKGRVKAWVVFNEANWDGFRDDPQAYTEALQVAYTRAKQADPNITIVTSNFLSTEDGLSFLEDMYAYGAKGYFDVLGIDPYCYPVSPTQPNQNMFGQTFWRIPQLYELMLANGDDKPVWIIEFGYRTPGGQYTLGEGFTISEEDQATFLVQALEIAQNWPWLERFYIYEWMDSGNVELGYWGLIRENYSAPYEVKPAFYAVKEYLEN
jgi:hypothetical protein